MCKLANILEEGLRTFCENKTKAELGDRSEYIGASDIVGCPRRVIMDKINPPHHSFETLMRFERGHLAEDIVANALQAAGYGNFVRQHEIDATEALGAPIKAHLDFVWFGQSSISVLEVKTVSSIPDSPYETWEMQLHVQMGLLALSGVKVPIRGAILALDLNSGRHKVFNGYEYDEETSRNLLLKGVEMWEALAAIRTGHAEDDWPEKIAIQPSELCRFCNHSASCPHFRGDVEMPEIESEAQEILVLKAKKKALDAKIKDKSASLMEIFTEAGIEPGKKVRAGNLVLKLVSRRSQYLIKDAVVAKLEEIGEDISAYQRESVSQYIDIRGLK